MERRIEIKAGEKIRKGERGNKEKEEEISERGLNQSPSTLQPIAYRLKVESYIHPSQISILMT